MSGSVDARTRPCFEAAYPTRVPRALAGERFAFPTNLAAPALTAPSQPRTAAERTETPRWALSLSRIADPETRQAALAPAPARLNRPSGATSPGGWV